MTQPVYALSDKAKEALADSRKQASDEFNNGMLVNGIWHPVSLEQARKRHLERALRIYKNGMVEVNPESTIRVQCDYCHVIDRVMRDVKVFKCRCSPHIEQWVCRSQPE